MRHARKPTPSDAFADHAQKATSRWHPDLVGSVLDNGGDHLARQPRLRAVTRRVIAALPRLVRSGHDFAVAACDAAAVVARPGRRWPCKTRSASRANISRWRPRLLLVRNQRLAVAWPWAPILLRRARGLPKLAGFRSAKAGSPRAPPTRAVNTARPSREAIGARIAPGPSGWRGGSRADPRSQASAARHVAVDAEALSRSVRARMRDRQRVLPRCYLHVNWCRARASRDLAARIRPPSVREFCLILSFAGISSVPLPGFEPGFPP